MAEYLGAKINPHSGYENDICIYIKCCKHDNNHPKLTFFDVVDAKKRIAWLLRHPDVNVIAISEVARDYLSLNLNRNDIILIPHHHCNYERAKRPKRPVKVVGIIGSDDSFQYPIKRFENHIKKYGLKLRYDRPYWPLYDEHENYLGKNGRNKVCNFYKDIDIQVTWRKRKLQEDLRNPLKLANAGSFGIPTISYPEMSFEREWKGCYLPETKWQGLMGTLKRLSEDPVYYQEIADKALKKSENYHIEKIAKLYKELENYGFPPY